MCLIVTLLCDSVVMQESPYFPVWIPSIERLSLCPPRLLMTQDICWRAAPIPVSLSFYHFLYLVKIGFSQDARGLTTEALEVAFTCSSSSFERKFYTSQISSVFLFALTFPQQQQPCMVNCGIHFGWG